MRARTAARGRLAALGAAAMLAAAPASARLQLDYLAIRSNEGGSAGGHAAIRFGDETFHFEHALGLLRLEREDSRRFQHVYRTLQNRDIELSRVPVSSETYRRLREVFRRRALVQERQIEIAAELDRDARLLESLLGEDPGLEVRGAGFFEAEPAAAPDLDFAPGELAALCERIEALHGRDFLERRRSELERSLEALAPSPPSSAVPLSADRYPDFPFSYSRRLENALAARTALALLAQPRPLALGALASGWEELPLVPAEEARLRRLAGELREQMARLAASPREDFGYPLLLGMARLAAIEISLRSHRLALLDPFPAQSRRLELGARRRVHLPGGCEPALAGARPSSARWRPPRGAGSSCARRRRGRPRSGCRSALCSPRRARGCRWPGCRAGRRRSRSRSSRPAPLRPRTARSSRSSTGTT